MRLSAAGLLLALGGCATPFNWQRAGLTPEILLTLEVEDWGNPQGVWDWPRRAAEMGVPIEARPVAVRKVKCEGIGVFSCRYLVDYGRGGIVEGAYKQRTDVGKNETGKWSKDWIVLVH